MGKSSKSSETRLSWSEVEVRRGSDDESSGVSLGSSLGKLVKNEIFLIMAPLLVALCLPFPLAALLDSGEEAVAESDAVEEQVEAGKGLESVFGRSSSFVSEREYTSTAPETGSSIGDIDGTLDWLPDAIKTSATRDVARELVEQINYGEYEFPDDVAAGRFLEYFENMSIWLEDIDMAGARLRRRTGRWVVVEARYAPYGGAEFGGIEGTAELRFVIRKGKWLIEHIKIHRGVPFR